MLAHRRDYIVEIVVQHPHHGARRHRVGQEREVAEIDQHQRRGDRRHIATAYLPLENEAAGFLADIGGQHMGDKAPERLYFDGHRQGRQHLVEEV